MAEKNPAPGVTGNGAYGLEASNHIALIILNLQAITASAWPRLAGAVILAAMAAGGAK